MPSAATQYGKSGDTIPQFSATLRDAAGVPVALLTTDLVTFKLRERMSAGASMGGTATIIEPDIDVATDPDNPNLGLVEYILAPGTVLTPGVYLAEWMLHSVSGHETTFPDVGADTVYISRRLPAPA
jgi:hypothetical protein